MPYDVKTLTSLQFLSQTMLIPLKVNIQLVYHSNTQ